MIGGGGKSAAHVAGTLIGSISAAAIRVGVNEIVNATSIVLQKVSSNIISQAGNQDPKLMAISS